MAFEWITKHTSPNYTPEGRVSATWGRPRTIEKIAIHWWGDPNNKPTLDGVVSWLCNPKSGASAHFVASGTGRKVACIVNLNDASWATNSANPYTLSIECDPRARPEDYDVVAELIAQIRSIYGNLPLVPHKQFVATACPGTYSLSKLDSIAKTKQVSKSDPWGKVSNKTVTPAPKPAPKPAPAPAKPMYRVFVGSKQVGAYTVEKSAWNIYVSNKGTKITKDNKDVTATLKAKYTPAPAPTPAPKPPVVVTQPSGDGFTAADRTVLQDIHKLLKTLVDMFTAYVKK